MEQELPSLFVTHHLNEIKQPVKFHEYLLYGFRVMAWTSFSFQIHITQKPSANEMSSLFAPHCLIEIKSPVKFHDLYISYSVEVMAQT